MYGTNVKYKYIVKVASWTETQNYKETYESKSGEAETYLGISDQSVTYSMTPQKIEYSDYTYNCLAPELIDEVINNNFNEKNKTIVR